MPSDSVSKAANLARIRENQRRCRARRREYISELEQRVQTYERRGVTATVEIQTTAQKLARENEILRGLLRSVGFDDEFQNEYIRAESQQPAATRDELVVSPPRSSQSTNSRWAKPTVMNEPLTEHVTNTRGPEVLSTDIVRFTDTHDKPLNLRDGEITTNPGTMPTQIDSELAFSLAGEPDISQLQLPPQLPLPTSELSSCIFPNIWGGRVFDLPDDGSMLCSAAYELIMKHNKKGYDDFQLNIKLCGGFMKGRTPLEGCRVEKNVVFSVLAEIS